MKLGIGAAAIAIALTSGTAGAQDGILGRIGKGLMQAGKDAASGFQLTKQAVGDVKLTEIRRQARLDDRETAMGFYAKNENDEVVDLKKGTRSRREILDMGDKQKERLLESIVEAHSQEKSIERLVNDYFNNSAALDDKLVLAHSRAEVSALNAGIR